MVKNKYSVPEGETCPEKIKYCNSYPASITEVGKNFDTIQVKTKSMLNDFEETMFLTALLVLGPQYNPWDCIN